MLFIRDTHFPSFRFGALVLSTSVMTFPPVLKTKNSSILHSSAIHVTSSTKFTWFYSVWNDIIKDRMATHSSVLAWRLPGMVEPDGLLSMGSHRVQHDWSILAVAAAAVCLCIPYFSCSFSLYYNYLLYWAMSSLRATSRSVVLPLFSICLFGYLCAQQWCVFGCVCSVVSYPFQPHGL